MINPTFPNLSKYQKKIIHNKIYKIQIIIFKNKHYQEKILKNLTPTIPKDKSKEIYLIILTTKIQKVFSTKILNQTSFLTTVLKF